MPNKDVVEALGIGLGGVVIWFMAVHFDAMEQLIQVMGDHESWQLDEIILAVVCVELAGFRFKRRTAAHLNNVELGKGVVVPDGSNGLSLE